MYVRVLLLVRQRNTFEQNTPAHLDGEIFFSKEVSTTSARLLSTTEVSKPSKCVLQLPTVHGTVWLYRLFQQGRKDCRR
jgi:hypothetical protein